MKIKSTQGTVPCVTKKIFLTVATAVTIILEIVPYGAVLNFSGDGGKIWRYTYSYFDLIPFGYANFGPFLTAVLTCVLFVLSIIGLFKYSKGLNIAIMNISGIAVVTSLLPLMFGIDYITVLGMIITLLLACIFGICFIKNKNNHI